MFVSWVFSFWFLVFQLSHSGQCLFGSRTNFFLSDKAESAFETRQVFVARGEAERFLPSKPSFSLALRLTMWRISPASFQNVDESVPPLRLADIPDQWMGRYLKRLAAAVAP